LVPIVGFAAILATLTACNGRTDQQNDADIQRRSAEATQKIKAGAEKAEAAAKPVLKDAARRLGDVATGVQQGMTNGSPPAKPLAGRIDINSATHDQLAALPGIGSDTADDIIAARPYAFPRQLVKKGVVTAAEYQRISPKLVAR
jgi:DNA uptake protein ComE-like DNA-binding protein